MSTPNSTAVLKTATASMLALGHKTVCKQAAFFVASAQLSQQFFDQALKAKAPLSLTDAALGHLEAVTELGAGAAADQIALATNYARFGYQNLVHLRLVPKSMLASALLEKVLGAAERQVLRAVSTAKRGLETAAASAKTLQPVTAQG